jgi:flagellar motor protein MotB
LGPFDKQSMIYSLAAHFVALLLMVFGLPAIFPEKAEPEPFVMTLEVVPISELTNLPSADRPIQKKQTAPTPPTPKPQPPTAEEKPKEAEPTPEKEEEEVVPEEAEEVKKEKKKEEKKEKKEEQKPDELAALLNKLKEESKEQEKDAKDKKTVVENTTRSDKPYDPALPLSITEKDAIRSQFVKCWRMPAGAPNSNELAARVRVQMNPDGSVLKVELASDQRGRYSSDRFFRAAADSAMRAVWKCNPLQNLPPDKFDAWGDMELNFDPSELLY